MALRSLLVVLLLACSDGGTQATHRGREVVPVRVGMVALDPRAATPVVVLEEENGSRWLPIWIGTAEARSIITKIDDRTPARPNTHDLAGRLIEGLDAEVVRAVVTELRGGTYYAILELRAGGEIVEIDSRPSDAIAIALRTDAPILVSTDLFEPPPEAPESDEPEEAIHWRPRGGKPTGTSPATPGVNL